MRRALRGLNKLDQALDIQNDLLKEYEKISEQSLLPIELIYVERSLIYEELLKYISQKGLESKAKSTHTLLMKTYLKMHG